MALFVAVAAVATASSASAQETGGKPDAQVLGKPAVASEAESLYAEGLRLFDSRQFAAAAVEFVRAFEIEADPFLAYNAGRAFENNGELDKARAWFSKALEGNPPEEVGELAESGLIRLQNAEATLRDKLLAKTGKISVNADEASDVFIDGHLKGRTPVEFELEPGKYRIEIRGEEGESVIREVQLDAGETETVVAKVDQRPGLLSWVGWTGVGVAAAGTAAVASGVIFAGEAQTDFDAAQNLSAAEIRAGVRFDELRESGEKNKSLAMGFYTVGGGLTGVGVALIIYDLSAEEVAPRTAHRLRFAVGPSAVSISGSW